MQVVKALKEKLGEMVENGRKWGESEKNGEAKQSTGAQQFSLFAPSPPP